MAIEMPKSGIDAVGDYEQMSGWRLIRLSWHICAEA